MSSLAATSATNTNNNKPPTPALKNRPSSDKISNPQSDSPNQTMLEISQSFEQNGNDEDRTG